MPYSMWSSISSWWSLTPEQTAEAELYLMRKSGYFEGATVGNADACTTDDASAISEAFQLAGKESPSDNMLSKHSRFFTIGTELAKNGKIGFERLVDIGTPAPGTNRPGFLERLGLRHHPRLVNTLEIGTPVPPEQRSPGERQIVLVHGYAAGLAFFYRNLSMFGSLPNSRFFAFDWIGMGRSSRPPYTLPHSKPRSSERVQAAEAYFLSSLEQWREKMKIEKMVLVGHSLGGYLSVAYALKHPERVERLVLVSPVGIPEGSWDLKAQTKVEERRSESKDLPLEKQDSAGAQSARSVTTHQEGSMGPPRRFSNRTLSFLGWLWDHNVSIFGILRSSSFFGPWLISGYTKRRFGSVPPDELQCMHAYCHGIFSGRGSSEYCRTLTRTDPSG